MSHFIVLVIGDNHEAQLAPFQENNMGDCPKQYLKFHDKTDELNEGYAEKKAEYPTMEAYAEQYHGYRKDAETGRYGYWENPNAKWDWWSVGGRWTGYFKLKAGRTGEVGRPGIMTPDAKDGHADQVRKGDVDFEGMRHDHEVKQLEDFHAFMKAIGSDTIPSWNEIREKHGEGNIDAARKEYAQLPAVKRIESNNDLEHRHIFMKDLREFLCNGDIDAYRRRARESAITTFAVLKDGQWYERGEMGWFACVGNEKPADIWNREFNSLMDSLPDDTLLTVVDCHI